MKDRQITLMVQGQHASGAPARVKIEMVLDWEEVMTTVRTGALPIPVADDLLLKLLEL